MWAWLQGLCPASAAEPSLWTPGATWQRLCPIFLEGKYSVLSDGAREWEGETVPGGGAARSLEGRGRQNARVHTRVLPMTGRRGYRLTAVGGSSR